MSLGLSKDWRPGVLTNMIGVSLSSEKALKRSIPKILSKVASFSLEDSGDDGFNNYGRGWHGRSGKGWRDLAAAGRALWILRVTSATSSDVKWSSGNPA